MYHQQWDLSYQRQAGHDWLLTVAYLGNKATHLRASVESNPAVYIPGASTVANTQQRRTLTLLNPSQGPFYSNITLADDGVTTSYNALRVSAQHRFSNLRRPFDVDAVRDVVLVETILHRACPPLSQAAADYSSAGNRKQG